MPNPYQLDPPAGVWYARYWEAGEERRESTGCHDHRKATLWLKQKRAEVAARRDKVRLARQLGLPIPKPERQERFPLADLLTDYEGHYKAIGGNELREDRGRAWVKEAKRSLERFVEYAADRGIRVVQKVDRPLVEDFLRARALDDGKGGGKVSNHTLKTTLKVVKTFLMYAEDRGYIAANPARRLKPPRTVGYEVVFLAEKAARAVMAKAPEAAPALFPMIATAIYAGLRAGELAALEWPDVRFREGFLFVRNKRRVADVREGFHTKSRRGRMVPLNPLLAGILEPVKRDAGLCFPAPGGDRWAGPDLAHAINEASAAVEVLFTLQVLRRTFGSLLLAAGEKIERISKWLGHASVRTTQTWYAALLDFDERDLEGVARLDLRTPDSPPDSQGPVRGRAARRKAKPRKD